MRKIKTTPEGERPNRFTDMSGWVIDPKEPPTRADALQRLWAAYFDGKTDEIPAAKAVEAELERLRELHAKGAWSRD